MNLYRVSLEWKDILAEKEWEDRLYKATRQSIPFVDSRPPRKTLDKYVAVIPDFGGSPVARAADLACETVIGGRSYWEAYEVIVLAVQYVGLVSIESSGADEPEPK